MFNKVNWFKKMICLAVAALFVTPAAAEAWKTYHNARFGTTADVPANWQSGEPPENGDGLVFTAPSGNASLIVSGSLNSWDSVAEGMGFYEQPKEGATITYKHREARAITLSGTKGDLIFYEKHVLSCADQIWNSIYLEYPAAQKQDFDPIVSRVAHSLRPGRSGQVPHCSK